MHLAIVSHFNPEFTEETVQFLTYFQKQLNFPDFKIHFYNQSNFDEGIRIGDFFKDIAKIDDSLLVYYGGHGYKFGWHLGDKYGLSYGMMIEILKIRKKPIIFVNDCCYAMALGKHLTDLKCEYLLLGLAPEDFTGRGSLVKYLIRDWKNRRPARPEKWSWRAKFRPDIAKLRLGAQLDHLCYPEK